jgi:thiol-disulfide isomerase/thioredoxin
MYSRLFFSLRRAALFVLVTTGLLSQAAHLFADIIPVNQKAPELVGGPWLNTAGRAPITLASRKGSVTVVEFWTFACINCRHNLPAYAHWNQKFASRGVVVLGIHTPETAPEYVTENVERESQRLGIRYPVLLDRDHANWNRWNQEFWPTVYLIDKKGFIRYRWEGELEYNHAGGQTKIDSLIETLLTEK